MMLLTVMEYYHNYKDEVLSVSDAPDGELCAEI